MISKATLFYIIGYPASGKTTALTNAINSRVSRLHLKPFKHTHYDNGLIQIGAERDSFGGTDTLALNAQPKVLEGLSSATEGVYLGEGDRLANIKFFTAVKEAGVGLQIIHIDVPEIEAEYRAYRRGHSFNPTWFKGRLTKVNNLVRFYRGKGLIQLDGKLPPDKVATALKEIINA